jgi:hypothetical protein
MRLRVSTSALRAAGPYVLLAVSPAAARSTLWVMKRFLSVAAAAAATASLAAGCGGGGTTAPTATASVSGGPGVFMTRILREEIRGQWGKQWSELHPAHQALITQSQYVACSRRMGTDFATGREVFRVLDVRNEAIKVRGVPQRTAKLVTINFREPGKPNGLTYHMHAVSVGGRWAWILGGRFLSALSHGQCLDGSPLRATA